MHLIRGHRARRIPALIASLALFVVGSNYCVLSGLAGDTSMACLTMPRDASAAAVPACHRTAPATGSQHEKPAARPSCCPDPVMASAAPLVEEADTVSRPLADDMLATVISAASPATIQWHGHRPAPDGPTPTRLARAPVQARAPPLA